MKSTDVRKTFLQYFAERGHRLIPSSPLVLPNDPTLLFANAGMNQFKDVFTGRESLECNRAASSQKCMRVSGKHNDLEMVGRTPRHHTFFEMLGNFSFGDYFKEDAIRFAWELLTEVYGLDADRLRVTVFGGSASAEADEEAYRLWRDGIGVKEDRILRLGEKENFWRMGDTGPCGPCTELHYDLGEALTSVEGESNPETDDNRFMEIWNLVFMQFDQQKDGRLAPLPAPSVDTGMGLERISAVLQGVTSNYETDLFTPILEAVARRAGVSQGSDPEMDVSMRVIADHARAMCFLIADGIIPANDNRGYVLRRILRRAIRHGRKLGIGDPFLADVTPVVLESLGGCYPEIVTAGDAILEIGRLEERRFSETLGTGLQMLDDAFSETAKGGGRTLAGKTLFRLYDTFGLPLDLARDVAEEKGFDLDEAGFEEEMTRQRTKAQASWKGVADGQVPPVYRELAESGGNRFDGYAHVALDGALIRAILVEGVPVDSLSEGEKGEAILDSTPLYAEAGGQVGDTGVLTGPSGQAAVQDTRMPVSGLNIACIQVLSGSLQVGEAVVVDVDTDRRDAIRRNHTGTHLLHAALRVVVGPHVKQAGSRVGPDQLRFDFTHFAGLTDQALEDIEDLVNRKILENIPVTTEERGIDEAVRMGAMALFGEKYGETVRVVRVGDFSLELCGGTHCLTSSEIGLMKITGERGIASGVRRIEAVTGAGALALFRTTSAVVRRIEGILAVPASELGEEIGRRMDQSRNLQRELDRLRVGAVRQSLMAQAEDAPKVAGIRLLAARVDGMKPAEMRELADELLRKLDSGVLVLGRAEEAKASILVGVSKDLTDKLHAGKLVKSLAEIIGGGGGGRKDMAEAGGKDSARLDDALAAAPQQVTAQLEAAK
ncbi:MAG: alanine--tRNA ligase [Acidobacteria bacterium]|uniref:Alanine--tRNA ligase n=1 Tax=Candidatus Polarisedimenticola svalbardensis TaxID=2886004 RepID=A0A8J6XWF5_9BACT|nr:alanine--tRNA ligase [Candidatus Polarisedimenticola svalbardensis]